MDLITAPLPEAERARIAAAYGVTKVPETVTIVRRGHSGINLFPTQEEQRAAIKAATWRGRAPSAAVALRRKKVSALAAKGLTARQVAHELGERVHLVAQDFTRLGLGKRRSSEQELAERRARVRKLRRQGFSYQQIAGRLCVPRTTVEADVRWHMKRAVHL